MHFLKYYITLLFFYTCQFVVGQSEISIAVTASLDTVLMGNDFSITYTIENADIEHFDAPAFDNFELIGGPNQSSSYTIINGVRSSKIAYTYYLRPIKEGIFEIPAAVVQTENEEIFSSALTVVVAPNPEGIIQEQVSTNQNQYFEWHMGAPYENQQEQQANPSRKKRKTVKM